MVSGILSGILWALATIALGVALDMSAFCSTPQALFLAPFVSTFLHNASSALWGAIYNGFRGNLPKVWRALKTKSGRIVAVAAVIGGPVGMTGYLLAIKYMGASIGAVASAIFPAIGTVLAYFFLKEKVKRSQWIFLAFTLLGVYGLSYSPDMQITNFWLGLAGTAMCSIGWGVEAVILAKCLKDPAVTDECVLQIRQTTSALVYGVVLLPILKGWGFTADLFTAANWPLLGAIALAGLFATGSYLFYYKAIAGIGASKAMALNVTYCAWSIIFTVLILRDTSALTPTTILCALVVLVCGVFAATDITTIFGKKSR